MIYCQISNYGTFILAIYVDWSIKMLCVRYDSEVYLGMAKVKNEGARAMAVVRPAGAY